MCMLLHLKIILLKKSLRTALRNKAVRDCYDLFFDGEQIFPDQANNFKIFLVSKMANTY